ncbi:zwei Ig domain protein zig-8-like [Sitodiplosis mosellana]|uniref:zwei Ig domain protein zig-8-like n=1 Tax=Sitodiplosis mosellana TaxID=263140 RepID=UPI002443D351|nr:zwei Ig domain protein zig-8-like [Sitodiplosis mosellana]XP_055301878.1 zwei Ig domain protein zig-8-like [Sitodiplosis mosellana]XP_055301879.1 zwei Ig domain protein zig-8-like [Sitodiplosis mosellana]XP_055301880.1 zwei Ig domain protein zig-8-like [Sitodiplosis mosellana]XP_055301882.1 zwei Ig domain protein zig-8-like [Sitodiplosis mosellana]XP_055301883.1 zwei Ig domain protein zig-8-like [Sitodiplosis mosellana]XP_055301884.1 zwei Ig domain protein zig-8-like [Sitodiplosis mosellan
MIQHFIIFTSILYTFSDAITRPDIDRMQPPLASSSMTTIPTTMTQRVNITMDTVTRSQWLISSLSASTERPSNLSASTKGTSSVSSKPIISSPPSIALPLTAPSSSEPLGKPNLQNDFDIGPYLDDTRITNITVQVGTNAYLPCKVKQLGNKSVSWVRVRDDHILSVDRITFIADERFQAYFKEELKQWVLQIKYVQPRDVGLYECQVSTEPKVSARAYLHVVVPRTELIGDSDRYVKTGSTVHLQCIIYGAIEPPTYIMWYHDTQPIHADNKLGYKMHLIKSNVLRNNDGVKFELNDLVQSPLDDAIQRQNSVGSLLIESTRKYHSGNYSCNPSNSAPSTVTLHVISSESSASAVKSSASQKRLLSLFFYTLCIIEMLLTITQRQT